MPVTGKPECSACDLNETFVVTMHCRPVFPKFQITLNLYFTVLTATKRSHFSILCVDLRNICNPFAQHIHWNIVAVFVFPVCSLIAGSLHLGPTVRWHQEKELKSFPCYIQHISFKIISIKPEYTKGEEDCRKNISILIIIHKSVFSNIFILRFHSQETQCSRSPVQQLVWNKPN